MNNSMLSALAVVALLVTAALAIPARAEGLDVLAEGDFGLQSFGTANDTAHFHMEITNGGSVDYTDVSLVADFTVDGWEDSAVNFSNDIVSGDGSISLGGLTASSTKWLDIEAPVPFGANPGEGSMLDVTVTADSDSPMVVSFGVVVTNWLAFNLTEMLAPGGSTQNFEINPETGVGDTRQYDIDVVNIAVDESGFSRATNDTITLAYTAVLPGWDVSFDPVLMMPEIVLHAPLAADYSTKVPVYVTLMDNIGAGLTTIDLQASSNDGPGVNENHFYTQPLGVLTLSADVAPYYRATVGGEGSEVATVEGGVLSWDFVVKNDGNTQDSFDLTWDTNGLPTGWYTNTATLPTTTGYMMMNAEPYSDTVTLSIPVGEAAGLEGIFTLYVASTTGGWSDTFGFSASILQFYDLSLEVSATEIIADPGNTVAFSFTVTNTGNGFDNYTIAVDTLATTYNPTTTLDFTGVILSGSEVVFGLSATVPADSPALASSGNFTVTVQSSDSATELNISVSVMTAQKFGLTWSYLTDANGTINSASAEAGGANGTVGLVLTNTGNGADTAANFTLVNAPDWAEFDDGSNKILISGANVTVWVTFDPPTDATLGDDTFQVSVTGGGGSVTSGDLTATVVVKATGSDGPGDIDTGEEEDKGWLPGFGLLAALSALGAALLLRRRR